VDYFLNTKTVMRIYHIVNWGYAGRLASKLSTELCRKIVHRVNVTQNSSV